MNMLQYLREQKGVTQKEVAKAIGFSPQYINDIENSRRAPSLGVALLIAQYFDTLIEDIFEMICVPAGVKQHEAE